ncbi:TRAP transporter substrate-binding protein [Petroclostridium sp. X23]|uniref:TRAP transporter substrate-binding protein n=1 Tax=Petroclostridium sp. X23 TaxID=3045146 RepID=UPI0024AE1BB1|nr:TRAP transporter substrate-binding protein [Petroclostridium sp. X23]WHH59260.1 TRAP transporter substrate-binding protein [Petroclostridium sp. X23]
MKKMKKLKKLISFICIAALLLSLIGCSSASKTDESQGPDTKADASQGTDAKKEKTYKIKLGHVTQESHPYHLTSMKFAELVKEKSEGRIDITIYPARQLGGDKDLIEMVQNGSLEMGAISSSIFEGFTPLLTALQLPFLLESYDTIDKVIPSDASNALLDGLDEIGIKGLGIYDSGFRYFINPKASVASLEDLKGKVYRVAEAPLLIEIYKALGASPTPIPYGEIYTALQTGTVDGADMDMPAIVAEKHYEVAKYVTISGHFSWPFALVMNPELFNSMSAEDQKIITDAAKECYEYNHKIIREMDDKSKTDLEKEGVTFNTISDKEKEELKQAVSGIYDQYTAKDKRILDFVDEVKKYK